MAKPGEGPDYHLTQDELDAEERFEASVDAHTRHAGRVRHGARFWCAVLLVLGMVIVGLIIFFPRRTPCHEQVIFEPTAGTQATLERCAPAGQHGGVYYGSP